MSFITRFIFVYFVVVTVLNFDFIYYTQAQARTCTISMSALAFETGDISYGHPIIAGWNMAIYDYHTHNFTNDFQYTALKGLNCTFDLHIRDSQTTTKHTVIEGLLLTLNFDQLKLNIPVMFGMPYSGPSVILNPLLDAFDMKC